jgi:hypothetical protein
MAQVTNSIQAAPEGTVAWCEDCSRDGRILWLTREEVQKHKADGHIVSPAGGYVSPEAATPSDVEGERRGFQQLTSTPAGERIKSFGQTKPAGDVVPGDVILDREGMEFTVTNVENDGKKVHIVTKGFGPGPNPDFTVPASRMVRVA